MSVSVYPEVMRASNGRSLVVWSTKRNHHRMLITSGVRILLYLKGNSHYCRVWSWVAQIWKRLQWFLQSGKRSVEMSYWNDLIWGRGRGTWGAHAPSCPQMKFAMSKSKILLRKMNNLTSTHYTYRLYISTYKICWFGAVVSSGND